MRTRLICLAGLVLPSLSCGGTARLPGPGLAYSGPSPSTARYETRDTILIGVEMPGQGTLNINVSNVATWRAHFSPLDPGARVTLDIEGFRARMTQPGMGTRTADESDIEGPLVMDLDARGHAELITRPALAGNAEEFFPTMTVAHSFFPLLPGRSVSVGDQWSDTIRFEGPEGGGRVEFEEVLNYLVVGPQVEKERRLLRVDMVGEVRTNTVSQLQGMEVSQALSGAVAGFFLWDESGRQLVRSFTESELRGVLEMSGGLGTMSVVARQVSHLRRIDPG